MGELYVIVDFMKSSVSEDVVHSYVRQRAYARSKIRSSTVREPILIRCEEARKGNSLQLTCTPANLCFKVSPVTLLMVTFEVI
jgi:hypothetical protein